MPFKILHNDITNMKTDAIVNAANSNLLMGGGVCGAIFKKAGEIELQKECLEKAPCKVGHAVITNGYNLDARYIIHTVGPIYHGGNSNESYYLKNAYKSALNLAKENNLKSISFPLISAGIYGYPKKEALEIAVSTIKEFLEEHDMDVYLVVFNREVVRLSEKLYDEISHYIDTFFKPQDRRYVSDIETIQVFDYEDLKERNKENNLNNEEEIGYHLEIKKREKEEVFAYKIPKIRDLEQILNNVGESFSQMLFRLIDERGKTDVEVYKRANIDRKLFSKIRTKKDYCPKKSTVLSLAIALELSLDETKDLLSKAGYSLSNSYKSDLIVKYFIENREYDIFTINEALFAFEEQTL